jgi:hypothetical protein
MKRTIPSLTLVALLTACAAGAGGSGSTTTSPPESDLDGYVAAALADASERLGVDAGELVVETAEAVTWPDGSIGCPEPGMGYTQALVEGHRIVISHDGSELAYHQGGDDEPFLCESPA